jgi:hypothetical protein
MTVYQHVVEYNSNDGIGNDITGISDHLDTLQINNKIITLKNNFSHNEPKIIESNLSQIPLRIMMYISYIMGYQDILFNFFPIFQEKKFSDFTILLLIISFISFVVRNFIKI